MGGAGLLVCALILDALLGEPKWLWDRVPHPAVLAGRLIAEMDRSLNHGPARRANGVFVVAGLVALGWLVGTILALFPWPVEVIAAAILLAHRSLVDHVRDVANAPRLSVGDGRLMVARIVGRDTKTLDGPGVSRAAIESAAENFGDGVVAPAFWLVIGGLPGLVIYKLINTADSMIGYRTDRHAAFGWAAARLDDLLNWVPARLTALLILAATASWHGWRVVRRDAGLHRSPNAGWPEAAMAVAVNVALSGPRVYDGQPTDDPFVHPEGRRSIGPADIDAAPTVLWRSWAVMLGLAALVWIV